MLGVFRSAQRDQAWRAVAEDLDLQYTSAWWKGRRLRGHRRDFEVRIHEVPDGKRGTKLVVEINNLDPGFTLGRDSALLRMVQSDIETGDPHFDRAIRIEGDPDWALALLTNEARRLAEIVISHWSGALRGNVLSAAYDDIEETSTVLDTVLDLGERLRQPDLRELPKLLMERACHDPDSPVRLQALRRLAASFPSRKEAVTAAETLFRSRPDILRLEACRLLVQSTSRQSYRAAEELAALAERHAIDVSIRRAALEALVESRYRPSAIRFLRKLLEKPDTPPAIRSVALDGLIRAEAGRELLEIPIDDDDEVETLARGLGSLDVSVQPRLLQLLDDSRHRVRIAAARSLGQVGDLDAVHALRQIADKDRLVVSALAQVATHAITNIKSRFGGSQQGEISIAQVASLDGAISPSDDDSEAGGEVSLTP